VPELEASLIVPTRNRWQQLAHTLGALAKQTALGRFEVIIADDGSDEAPPAGIGDQLELPLRLLRLGHVGIGPAKNRAIEAARGQVLIFINDDTYPQPDFVEQHLAAWREDAGNKVMHLGLTKWRQWRGANLFDCLIAESGMIFFYHNLQPGQICNFRHAWNCNLSVEASAVRDTGCFNEALGPFFFEDLELAFRLEQEGWRTRYRPEAVATHDHRYTPQQYLDRERLLGRMSAWLWQANPECFQAIYNTDLDARYLAYCRRYVDEQATAATAFSRHFLSWHGWSADILQSGQSRGAIVELFVEAHRALKRYTFRQGLLEEAEHSGPSGGN
jgi:GT2 family glycosyltransferase